MCFATRQACTWPLWEKRRDGKAIELLIDFFHPLKSSNFYRGYKQLRDLSSHPCVSMLFMNVFFLLSTELFLSQPHEEAGKCFHSDLDEDESFFCFAVFFHVSLCRAAAREFENGNSIKLFPELISRVLRFSSRMSEIAC